MAKIKKTYRRHRLPIRTNVMVGAPPGSLETQEAPEVPSIRVVAYGPEVVEEFWPTSAAELRELRGSQPVVWVHVDGVGNNETVRTIGEVFGLHTLALEDVTHVGQRPKADAYDDSLFIVVPLPRVTDKLELEQVSIFLGKDFVVTFQEQAGDALTPVLERIRNGRGQIRRRHSDYLAYALVDAIVDAYFPALESYGRLLDSLEGKVMSTSSSDINIEIHAIRQELGSLRRRLWALRETLGLLCRDDDDYFSKETKVFLRDCLDHTSQLMDIVESCREMGANLMEFHLSNMSQRMNEVMKVLTIIATLFIPLSFIAGLYGMNFDRSSSWNMPELGWSYGYPFALGLMAATALGFVIFFRRKGWLGQPSTENGTKPSNE